MNKALDEVRASEARKAGSGRLRTRAQKIEMVPAQKTGKPD